MTVAAKEARGGLVGTSVPRIEDEALLRGLGRFMDDLEPVANCHHAAVVRSPHAHARIRAIETTRALAVPGVTGVLTGAEVRDLTKPFTAACPSPVPYYAAAADTARFAGEPVAVVVARDRYVAEDAAALVEVDYEPLAPVMDALAATARDDALASDRSFAYGDVEAAFAAAHLVVRERFRFPRWSGTPMECAGVVAQWDHARDSLTAWCNFQGPFTVHSVAAAALGLPGARLRLVTPPDSGGSFGIKAGVISAVVLMGVASRKLGVPVKWIEDRLEHLAASQAATERTTDIEAAFAADGELLALRMDCVEDLGAYVRAPEPATLYRMHGCLNGAYRVRNVAVRNRAVLTNRCPSGLNRGFGGPQHYLPIEGAMAIAARRLGLDPTELARRNLIRAEDHPYETPSGGLYASGDYEGCLDAALDLAGYDAWRERRAAARAQGRLVGVGLACIVEPSISNMGYVTLVQPADERARALPKSGNAEGATIVVDPLGGVTVALATTPQGQGHATVAAQIVADTLGLALDNVTVRTDVDTQTSAWTVASGSYSSRFSGVGAGAVLRAAERIAAKARLIAAPQLGCDLDDVELRDGAAFARHDPEARVSWRRIAGVAHWDPFDLPDGVEPGLAATVFYATPGLPAPDAGDRLPPSGENGFVVDLALVEVDRDTGRLDVLDYVCVHDAGRLLHPAMAMGQVRGGLAHGAGAALQERVVYGADGALLTPTFKEYLCPTPSDLPHPRIAHRETPSPVTPLGAKGLGEGTTMSAPCALHNATLDALGADAPLELPLSPARLWERLP
jgi:2-furoyl-CoA dehydrogenase large subunit